MSKGLKSFVQVFFLAIFVVLIMRGRMQLWMGIFLGGIVIALFFGRFYCGWICPINTITDAINWSYKKLGIKRKEVPAWVKAPAIRYGVLLLFIAALGFTMISGRRLPILVILAGLGTLLTLFFTPSLWHRYLCPYGTILQVTGSGARLNFRVDEEECSGCGICEKVCPGEAVFHEDGKKSRQIRSGLCLECMSCFTACPKNCIKYMSKGRATGQPTV